MLLITLVAQPEKILVFGETGMKANDSHCFVPKFYVLNEEEYSKSKVILNWEYFALLQLFYFWKVLQSGSKIKNYVHKK